MSPDDSGQDVTVNNVSRNKSCVLLQTAHTFAYTANEELIPVRVLMDNGSQRSYVSQRLRSRLGLATLRKEQLTLNTFGNERFSKREGDLIRVRLVGKQDGDVDIVALSFPAICLPLQGQINLEQHPQLLDLELADVTTDKCAFDTIDMLIGSDHYWDVVTDGIVRSSEKLVAVSSKFGWLLSGPTNSVVKENDYSISNLIIEGHEEVESFNHGIDLTGELRHFWDTEAIGITEMVADSGKGSSFTEIVFDWNIGRYKVKLPWKTNCRPLTSGYDMCASRLRHLQLRLKRNKSLFKDYNEIIEKQLQDSIVKRVDDAQNSKDGHFLPHHGVTREDKETTKLRIVFDGSAKDAKTMYSLNECLEKGPNRIPHIFDVLVKFRRNLIGIVADIGFSPDCY